MTDLPMSDEMRDVLAKLFHRARPEMFTARERIMLVIWCRRFIEPSGPPLDLARDLAAGRFLVLEADIE